MNFKEKSVVCIVTGCHIGDIPVAPGTFGTLWGLPIAFGFARWPWGISAMAIVVLIVVAVLTAGQGQRLMGEHDPGRIVIDEIAGMAVTLWALPFTAGTAIAGFVLFRILDITKPWPVRWIDRRIGGGLGVVLDDVAAGIIANIVLRFARLWIGG